MKLVTFAVVLAAALTSTAACAPRPTGLDQIELQRVRAGNVDVVLLSNDGVLTHGEDSVTIEFRRGDTLVDVGEVKAAATMPMAGMPPMQGSVFLERSSVPGRYTAQTDLSMSGGWQLRLDWEGPAGPGTASFSAIAE